MSSLTCIEMSGLGSDEDPSSEWTVKYFAYTRTESLIYTPITSGSCFILEYGLYSATYYPIFAAPRTYVEGTEERLRSLLCGIADHGLHSLTRSESPQSALDLVTSYGLLMPADNGGKVQKLSKDLIAANSSLPVDRRCSIRKVSVKLKVKKAHINSNKSAKRDLSSSSTHTTSTDDMSNWSDAEDNGSDSDRSYYYSDRPYSLDSLADCDQMFLNPDSVFSFAFVDYSLQALDGVVSPSSYSSYRRDKGEKSPLGQGVSLYGLNFEGVHDELLSAIARRRCASTEEGERVGSKRKRSLPESLISAADTSTVSLLPVHTAAVVDGAALELGTPVLSHMREDCPSYPFCSAKSVSARNMVICDRCVCYLCDAPAGECKAWRNHCHATTKGKLRDFWKRQQKEHAKIHADKVRFEYTPRLILTNKPNIFLNLHSFLDRTGIIRLHEQLGRAESTCTFTLLTIWPSDCDIAVMGLKSAVNSLRSKLHHEECMSVLYTWRRLIELNIIIDHTPELISTMRDYICKHYPGDNIVAASYFIEHIYNPSTLPTEIHLVSYYMHSFFNHFMMNNILIQLFVNKVSACIPTVRGRLLMDAAANRGGYGVYTLPILIPKNDIVMYIHYKSMIACLLDEYLVCLTQCSTVIGVLKEHVFTAIDHYELYSYLPRLTEVIIRHKLSIRVLSKVIVSIPYDYLYYQNPSTLRPAPKTSPPTPPPLPTPVSPPSPLAEEPASFLDSVLAMRAVTRTPPPIPIPYVYSAVRTGIWADFFCSIVFEDRLPAAFLAQIEQGVPIETMLNTYPQHSSIDMLIAFLYKCSSTSHLPSLVTFTAWFLTQPMPRVSAIVGILSKIHIALLTPQLIELYFKLVTRLIEMIFAPSYFYPVKLTTGYPKLRASTDTTNTTTAETPLLHTHTLEIILGYMGYTKDIAMYNLSNNRCLTSVSDATYDLLDPHVLCMPSCGDTTADTEATSCTNIRTPYHTSSSSSSSSYTPIHVEGDVSKGSMLQPVVSVSEQVKRNRRYLLTNFKKHISELNYIQLCNYYITTYINKKSENVNEYTEYTAIHILISTEMIKRMMRSLTITTPTDYNIPYAYIIYDDLAALLPPALVTFLCSSAESVFIDPPTPGFEAARGYKKVLKKILRNSTLQDVLDIDVEDDDVYTCLKVVKVYVAMRETKDQCEYTLRGYLRRYAAGKQYMYTIYHMLYIYYTMLNCSLCIL